MADDEKTRWAIDVMTAWLDDRDDDLLHARIESYLGEPEGASALAIGLVNLSGLLLMGLETLIGKDGQEILQTIAMTVSRSSAATTRRDQASARASLAASTMLRSDSVTSSVLRVFSPQSGLTQRRSAGTAFSAFRKAVAISSVVGTRGEWMS